MSDSANLEFSRQIATARLLAGMADGDVEHFFDEPILLTGEPEFLRTSNGKWIFQDCAFLLARLTKCLVIEVRENDALTLEMKTLTSSITGHSVEVKTSVDPTKFAAVLSVGSKGNRSLPSTTINSNGWLARVSSMGSDLPEVCAHENPIGALAAASLGVVEVFKRLIKPKGDRGRLHDILSFSFFSYTQSDDAGPSISALNARNLLLVGGGAIGNGICQLLIQLPIKGNLLIVDRENYEEENLGTCLLLSTADVGKPKAEVLANLFGDELKARGFKEEIQTFINTELNGSTQYPSVVLAGLDNIQSRRELQTIWPDLAIDGAIGPLSCQVTLHPWGPDLSCLMCDFEEPVIAASKAQSELTGLSESRLENLLDVITEEDIQDAPTDKKDLLARNLGKQICSLLSEAEIEKMSKEKAKPGFQPSVPFVACLSACMVVAEFVRATGGHQSLLETGYQFDTLVGPQNGRPMSHARKKNCVCVDRKDLIETLRSKRSNAS
jgi:hypothetical protein